MLFCPTLTWPLGSGSMTERPSAVELARGLSRIARLWITSAPNCPCWHCLHMIKNLAKKALVRLKDEAGDVPGWVLITIMTAALVIGIWAVAAPLLIKTFEDAINGVTGP